MCLLFDILPNDKYANQDLRYICFAVVIVTDTATYATKNVVKIVIARTTRGHRAVRVERTRSHLVGRIRLEQCVIEIQL